MVGSRDGRLRVGFCGFAARFGLEREYVLTVDVEVGEEEGAEKAHVAVVGEKSRSEIVDHGVEETSGLLGSEGTEDFEPLLVEDEVAGEGSVFDLFVCHSSREGD